jgi:glycosyltransferase involved in cell wall biosynthesis
MSSSLQDAQVLLAYTRDSILASRSGYHVLADYLPGTGPIVTPRGDPTRGWSLLKARVLRRFAFSRWYTAGSYTMERLVQQRLGQGNTRAVHLLWCDRDMGFLDRWMDCLRHPLIGTFHQCADELPRLIRRPSALRKFAAIIIMSESQRPYFQEQGVQADRIHCILHGVDTEHFAPADSRRADRFTVLSVGGTRRDFPLMHEIAQKMQGTSAIHFEIVGPGDRRAVFEGLSNVSYHSGISDEALLDHYRQAGCYLHLAEAATANNALLEGLSCGLPVITQRVGGVPEYVTTGCAEICPPSASAPIIDAIQALASSPERQAAMRAAARAHALTLDWRHAARLTQSLYQSLN